ncbi:MAG: hypothetical protein DRR42_28290 [Gammaproteobacteria bacterium]|nr:MAG: hypothetical protein DRR42_28290 [Gammaproteobacteria bacterium]
MNIPLRSIPMTHLDVNGSLDLMTNSSSRTLLCHASVYMCILQCFVGCSIGEESVQPNVSAQLDDYDSQFRQTVFENWHGLLAQQLAGTHSTGKVVVRFDLDRDGNKENLRVLEKTVGLTLSMICEKAVMITPYPDLPEDVRSILADQREFSVTFWYGMNEKPNPLETIPDGLSQF